MKISYQIVLYLARKWGHQQLPHLTSTVGKLNDAEMGSATITPLSRVNYENTIWWLTPILFIHSLLVAILLELVHTNRACKKTVFSEKPEQRKI